MPTPGTRPLALRPEPRLLVLSLALAASGAAGLRAADGPRSPAASERTRAGEVTLTPRRVELRRHASARLDSRGRIAAATGDTLEVVLELALTARSAPEVEAVLRGPIPRSSGAFEAVDTAGRTTRDISAEVLELEENPVLRLTVRGLSPAASGLRVLKGELPAYPRVKRVRFHIPWLKDEVPLNVDYQGGRATLERFQLVEETSTLWVSVAPPEGFRVAPFELPGALDARAMDIYGNLVNQGGITSTVRTRTGEIPQFRFVAPGLKKTPSRLVLDVLCVAGEPRGLRFGFTGLTLLPPGR